jgi:hypothetical protein
MTLMTLVRLIGAVVIGWTLVAIGIGASGTRLPRREATSLLPPESPKLDAMPTRWPADDRYELVDRTNGRTSPIRLPDGDRWSNISVSPWRGPGGELEAVGRWVNPKRDDFSGWGIFRLSDGTVRHRFATEIIPSGRPCWVPGQTPTMLFAAGDGRLHRCHLDAESDETRTETGADGPVVSYATGRTDPSELVVWEAPFPGSIEPRLNDPAWLDHPSLKKWVFASLMRLDAGRPRWVYGRSHIWWLEMREDGRAIVDAGRLTGTAENESLSDSFEERLPNVAVGPAGEIHLVYLQRQVRDNEWRLRSTALELDGRTGQPRALNGSDSLVTPPRVRLKPVSLLVSADGMTVYGVSKSGGLVALPSVGCGSTTDLSLPRERTSLQP